MPGPHSLALSTFVAAVLCALPALAGEHEEIESAIVFGRCGEAATQARSLVAATPEDPRGWRLLGDAERCLGRSRAAVLAYQRLVDLGGDDPGLEPLIESLREQLGRIRVTVETDRPAPLRVEAILPEEGPAPAVLQPDGTWLVADVEPGAGATVRVRGTGIEPTERVSDPVSFGGETAVTLRPLWRGIGVLQLLNAPPTGVRVEVPGLDGWQPLEPDQGVRVTAGLVPVAIEGPLGRLEAPVDVPSDGRVRFDPTVWEPSSLRVSGAPAGADLQLFLEGIEPPMERAVRLPEQGEVDADWGVLVAPPLELSGLVGGVGSVVVQHAELGVIASELVLETGAANSLELDWRQMEGSASVRSRYLAWQASRRAVVTETRTGVGVGLATAGGALALSAIAWGAAGASNARLKEARTQALAGTQHVDGPEGWFEQHAAAAAAERAWIGVAAAAVTVGVAGLGVAGAFGARGKVRLDQLGPWTPP